MSPGSLPFTSALVILGLAGSLLEQASAPRASGLVLLTASGRRALPTVVVGDREMVSLDDLAPVFQLSVREDILAGGVTVTYKGKTIVLTPDQAVASVAGRLVSLPSAVVREGRRWLVPLDFINRALALVYDTRLEYRRASRLIILGDIRVPRVAGRGELLGSQARLTFEISGRVSPTVVQEPGRLLVKFDAEALDASLGMTPLPGLVESVQLVEPGNAIAVNLGRKFASYRASTLPIGGPAPEAQQNRGARDQGASTRLVIDILATGAEAAPAPPSPSASAPPPVAPPTPIVLPPAAPSLRTVVLDPGHGGTEDGVRGADGTLEKDLTLALARRLKTALEGRLGVQVLLTRDSDQSVPPDERAALANNNKADLLLSLHANASLSHQVSGAQVYYLDGGTTGEAGGRPGGQLLPALGGGVREIAVIPWEMAQAGHVAESAAFAEIVRAQLSERVPMNPRAVERAPLRVLVGANMPAVVVETGFLSNPAQERQLKSGEFQNLLAQSLLEAIVRFKDALERGTLSPVPMPGGDARPRL